jgi:hypothetical protein
MCGNLCDGNVGPCNGSVCCPDQWSGCANGTPNTCYHTYFDAAHCGSSCTQCNYGDACNYGVCETCNGDTNFQGCRGSGCWVCEEIVANYPHYFDNHPACLPNKTCAGQYYTCNHKCPAPTAADL